MTQHTTSRKFQDIGFYSQFQSSYYLLPFHFIKINDRKEILVNSVGDFLIVPIETAGRIANHTFPTDDILYKDLIANFFISEKPIPDLIDVLATRYRTKKSFLGTFTSLHIFVVTLRCNHTCHYCQVSRVTENKTEYDISYQHLEQGIRHMLSSPSEYITMEFQGGEPLLAFDKVKFAVSKALQLNETYKKKISFVICTNATIISADILAFCKANHILISTSLDGPEFIHNANRKTNRNDSYANVITGIEKFRETLGHDQVAALMTTSALSLEHPIEIIDCYIANNFSNIFLRPISPYGFALRSEKKNKYQTEKFFEFYRTGLNYIIDLNLKGQFFSEDYATILLKKILTPFATTYVDLQSPAGLINSVVVFNYDGYVYASDEARMIAENQDFTFRLGHVSESYRVLFYGTKAKEFSQYWSNEALAGCADCAFQMYCGADPIHHYATQGDFEGYRPTSTFCQKNMEILKLLFNMIDERGEEVLPVFYRWISNSH